MAGAAAGAVAGGAIVVRGWCAGTHGPAHCLNAYARLRSLWCATLVTQTSLYTVKAVLVLDTEGKRILGKYYGNDFPTIKDQFIFERNLFEKTKRVPGTALAGAGRSRKRPTSRLTTAMCHVGGRAAQRARLSCSTA